jgi:MFS family permease
MADYKMKLDAISMDQAISKAPTSKQAAETGAAVGQPQEQMGIQDTLPDDDEIIYPSGIRLWMAVASLCIVSVLFGLDLTIVATTVPSLTNYFQTVEDIGWYSSAYSVMTASFTFLFGKLYSLASVKMLYIISICIFELGSLLCTVAATSAMFILGRAVAGVGAAGIISGSVVILSQCFPRHKRPLWTTVIGSSQMIGIVSAPIVGGALIDWVGWRGCFGINLPLGVAAVTLVAFGFQNIVSNSDDELPWKAKLKRFDWFGTVFLVPAVTCLLLALQWGGSKYGWGDPRIIVMLVLFVALLFAFGWRQHQLQEDATLPPRIIKMKSVVAAAWFASCVNATLGVTEYYLSIYFQGVKGYTASRSGILQTPMLVGITVGNLCGGAGIAWSGYYNRESPYIYAAAATRQQLAVR